MKRTTSRIMYGGLAAGLAVSVGACSPESRTDEGVAGETTHAIVTPSSATKRGSVVVKLHLDPNQKVLDSLDPTDNMMANGELDLHVLKVLQDEDGECSNTAIKLSLDRAPIPDERDASGNVEVTVDLPLGNESTECAAGYVAGPNGRTRGQYVGSFALGQGGNWEFHPVPPDGPTPTLIMPTR